MCTGALPESVQQRQVNKPILCRGVATVVQVRQPVAVAQVDVQLVGDAVAREHIAGHIQVAVVGDVEAPVFQAGHAGQDLVSGAGSQAQGDLVYFVLHQQGQLDVAQLFVGVMALAIGGEQGHRGADDGKSRLGREPEGAGELCLIKSTELVAYKGPGIQFTGRHLRGGKGFVHVRYIQRGL